MTMNSSHPRWHPRLRGQLGLRVAASALAGGTIMCGQIASAQGRPPIALPGGMKKPTNGDVIQILNQWQNGVIKQTDNNTARANGMLDMSEWNSGIRIWEDEAQEIPDPTTKKPITPTDPSKASPAVAKLIDDMNDPGQTEARYRAQNASTDLLTALLAWDQTHDASLNARIQGDLQQAEAFYGTGEGFAVALFAIYAHYDPARGTLINVQVPSTQIAGLTKVLTQSSTQLVIPSTQVATGTSSAMTTPNLNPATGVSSVMTTPNLNPATGVSSVMTTPDLNPPTGVSSVMTTPDTLPANGTSSVLNQSGTFNNDQPVLCGN